MLADLASQIDGLPDDGEEDEGVLLFCAKSSNIILGACA